MFRSILRKLFGRPKREHWTVADLIADPPGFDDLSHPLTIGYIQLETRVDSPGRVFVEEHIEEVRLGIEKALTHRDQLTRIKLCGILSLIDPREACDHLISIVCTEIVDADNRYHALHLIHWAPPSDRFASEAQQRQLHPHLMFLDRDDRRPELPNILPILDQKSYLRQRDSMAILFSMNILEAVETAHIYLDDPLFGEDFGLYLANVGDPAGWPALRRAIGDAALGIGDFGCVKVDIHRGLRGLAGWIELQIEELARQVVHESNTERLEIGVSSDSWVWDDLKWISELDIEEFGRVYTEMLNFQIDEKLNKAPAISPNGLRGE